MIVDGVLGNFIIAIHFQDKLYILFNSVQSLDVNLSLFRETIICREKCMCRDAGDSHLHGHIITKADVKKAIHTLKSIKIDEGGILFSNNFIHGTDLLYLYLSMLFNSMIDHGFTPDYFLHSSIVPIPKGTRANVSDSNMYRNIDISI